MRSVMLLQAGAKPFRDFVWEVTGVWSGAAETWIRAQVYLAGRPSRLRNEERRRHSLRESEGRTLAA